MKVTKQDLVNILVKAMATAESVEVQTYSVAKMNKRNNPLADESEKEVKVPDVVGHSEEDAKKMLNDLKLGCKVQYVESDKYDKGIVCEQKIKAGKTVPVHTKVEIVVSSKLVGEEIEIPNVSGYDEATAQKMLESKGLTVGTSEAVYSDEYEAGEVVGTTPEAGTMVTLETEIVMLVSKGSQKVKVPSVLGYSEDDAIAEFDAVDIVITKTTYDYNDTVEEGCVVSQSIDPGKKVEKGTGIEIVISRGEKPEEKVNVPNLSGLTLEGARALLESKGLLLVDGGEEYSEEAIGKVSRWEPYSTSVPKGTKITVWISKGLDAYEEELPTEEDETQEGVIEE